MQHYDMYAKMWLKMLCDQLHSAVVHEKLLEAAQSTIESNNYSNSTGLSSSQLRLLMFLVPLFFPTLVSVSMLLQI